MTTGSIMLIDLFAVVFMILIVNLVRTTKLHLGYAVVWLSAIAAFIIVISVPQLLSSVTRAVGAIYPVSALTLLAFIFMFLLIIFLSVQLSILSTRQLRLIEHVAIEEALREEANAHAMSLDPDNDAETI